MKAFSYIVGEAPKLIDIDNTLEALQGAVGGYIEVLPLEYGGCIVCDEEGLIKMKEPNRRVLLSGDRLVMIYGDFLLCGSQDGELTDVEV